MKKKINIVLLIIFALLIIVFPLSGCRKAKDTVNKEITEGITEKYLEGITGSNAELDIEDEKWPSDMPAIVPKIQKGKIDSSSSITVSGTTQLSVLITGVKEKD